MLLYNIFEVLDIVTNFKVILYLLDVLILYFEDDHRVGQ